MHTTNSILRALCVVVGLALVGAGPVAAAELAAAEGGPGTSCDVLYGEAFGAIAELDATLPVDPIRESAVVGRIQLITTQLNHDLFELGC